jgi:hypothetical protein
MNRLLKSSGFWTAIIASIVLVTAYKLTGSELIVTLIGGLFGIDKIGKASEDFVKANKGVTFNTETNKDEKII